MAGNRQPRRIVIVTPGYLASTPRVVREADALTAAGYDVRVAFTQGQVERLRAFDAEIVRSRRWRVSVFRWSDAHRSERAAYLSTGIRHRLAQMIPPDIVNVPGIAERAEGRVYPELAAAAAAEPADLFIGHYPVGLAAAAQAAARYGARLGYDAEDLYAETFPDQADWHRAKTRILQIEDRYAPAAAYLSAVSAPVAEAYRNRYGLATVLVHNCHPWAEREAMDGSVKERRGDALSLFWFSQTIGLDRGLQDGIRAAASSRVPIQIHLRGSVANEVRLALESVAAECGLAGALSFHPSCPPGELLSRAAEHDVGLALETEDSLNRRLTVTNKLFLYLTAGLAVAATDLPGQHTILETCAAAGRLHRRGDIQTLAAQLGEWSTNRARLNTAKAAALDAARTRWNAEAEGARLAETIDRVLAATAARDVASGE